VLPFLPGDGQYVAIANSRLLALEDDHVLFHWRDYADDNRLKVMRLTAAGSLSAGSCSMCCPSASSAFAITDSWPVATPPSS
jgi:hypothetical protein